ncbi:MAG TPA: PAS domain S-box protein [Polyangiaceae bacterium]|nr:PAS domain S-box protein [Polyangiaceae bacterium]
MSPENDAGAHPTDGPPRVDLDETPSAAVFRSIVDAMSATAYFDADLVCRYANPQAASFHGFPRALAGKHLREVVSPEVFVEREKDYRRALEGAPQHIERERTLPDGTTSHFVAHYVPHVVEGKAVGVVVFTTDLSDVRHANVMATVNQLLEQRVREQTQALRASNERFGTLFQSSPVAMKVRRLRDDVVIEVNESYLEFSGSSRGELVGRRVPVEHVRLREDAQRSHARPDGSIRDVEVPFQTKTGEVKTALASSQVIDFAEDGPCAVSTFIDITDRKRAERRLAAQHAVSRVLADATSLAEAAPPIIEAICASESWDFGAIWRAHEDGRLACAGAWHRPGSEALTQFVEETRRFAFAKGEGVPGQVWSVGLPRIVSDLPAEPGFLRGATAARAGLRSAFVFPIRHGDEVTGVIELIGRAPPSDPEFREMLAAVGRQIGLFVARSRAAAEIQRSESRLATVIEHLSEGLVIVSREGKVVHWNPAAIALHELEPGEDWNRTLADFHLLFELRTLDGDQLIPLEDWPVARVLRGMQVKGYEVRISRRDRSWQRAFSYGGSVVTLADGSEIAVMTIDDITERTRRDELRRLSEKLTEENRRIQEASRLKSEFLANMSHELRTPLNAIIGFTLLLERGKAGPVTAEQHEYLDDVLTSSRHLLQLINDILDLAKIEAGRVDLALEDVSPAVLVEEVTNAMRELARQKSLVLRTEIAPALGHVRLDVRMTKQILLNFLANAIKFTPTNGTVVLRAVPEDARSFRVEVEDTGIGIRPEDMSRLFVEFEQLDAGRSKHFQGTGLGLALSKKLAEAQGGRVGAESVFGKGSRFYVVLPLAAG